MPIVTVRPYKKEVRVAVPGPMGPAGAGGSGGNSEIQIVGSGWFPVPTATYTAGEQRFSLDGVLWICAASGTPGDWYSITGFVLYGSVSPDFYPALDIYPAADLYPFALYVITFYPGSDVLPASDLYPGS